MYESRNKQIGKFRNIKKLYLKKKLREKILVFKKMNKSFPQPSISGKSKINCTKNQAWQINFISNVNSQTGMLINRTENVL